MKSSVYIEATAIVPRKMSGIGHAVLQILRELDKEKYKDSYRVVIFAPYGEGADLERHGFSNILIKQLPFPHKVFSLLSRLRYGFPIDILLGKGIYIFPNYRNWNLLFSRSLTFFHDVSFLLYPQYTEPRNRAYLLRNFRKWLSRADRIITISNSSQREIIEQLGDKVRKDIDVVELGVDPLEFYPRTPREIVEVKTKHELSDSDYCLYIGNIEPRKNLEFLIKSYSSSEELKPITLLLVGGDGWLNEDILAEIERARAEGYRVVRNKTYVDDSDLPALITGARCVLLPSHHEGFGLSVVQAEACGVPVVASDIPVLREIGRGNFYYFDNNDTDSFEQAILSAMRAERVQAPQVAYTWEITVGKLLKLVEAVK